MIRYTIQGPNVVRMFVLFEGFVRARAAELAAALRPQ